MTDRRTLLADLDRVRAKRNASDDRDVRAALDARIAEIEAAIAALPVAAEPVKVPTTLTPQIVEQADGLLKRVQLERTRANWSAVESLLKEAVALAPDHPFVVLAEGEELERRGKWDEAKARFVRARELAPYDDRIEAKYAEAVLASRNAGSMDDQLRAALSDRPLLDTGDHVAGSKAAVLLSAFLPGLGHLVLGKTAAGIGLIVAWVALGLWVLFMAKDLSRLFAFAFGGSTQPNIVVLIPLFAMLAIWVSTLKSLTGGSSRAATRKNVARPAPPVDLPFE